MREHQRVDLVDFSQDGLGHHFVRFPSMNDSALFQEQDAVRPGGGQIEVVQDYQYTVGAFLAQPARECECNFLVMEVQGRSRLVGMAETDGQT